MVHAAVGFGPTLSLLTTAAESRVSKSILRLNDRLEDSEHSESLKHAPSKNVSKQDANKKSHVLGFLILYPTFPITLKA